MLDAICQVLICNSLYRKHFREAVGCNGLFLMLKEYDDKTARAECRIGLIVPGKELVFFTGKVEGNIVSPRGTGGFGWDSLFQPLNFNQTYAEMTPELKDSVSDRSLALQQLKEFMENNIDWFRT